jgi:hypothetical protein
MILAARVLGPSCSIDAKSVTGGYLMFGYDKRSADIGVTLLLVPLLLFRTSLASSNGPTSPSQTRSRVVLGLLAA